MSSNHLNGFANFGRTESTPEDFMRISGPAKPQTVTDATRPAAYGPDGRAAGTAPREVRDSASIMGVPAAELSPKAQAAITRLMAELESLRDVTVTADRFLALAEVLGPPGRAPVP